MSRDEMTRREFMKRAAAAGVAAWGVGKVGRWLGGGAAEAGAARPTIAVASNKSPAQLVRDAVAGLGGMEQFVKRGNSVLVKPNIAWARRPDQAATTNPEVVAEIVRLCRQAGASEVKVLDHAVDRPDALLLDITGIGAAAQQAGARVFMASSQAMYQRLELPRGRVLKQVDVLRDLQRSDVFINVPIAKVHGATDVTLALKNLMGVVWDRGAWHRSTSLDQCIADMAAEIGSHLVILDAIRVLLSNGPKGPGDTEDPRQVVAGTDPLAVDAYGVTLLHRKAEQINHLRLAHAAGVGEIDLARVNVKHV